MKLNKPSTIDESLIEESEFQTDNNESSEPENNSASEQSKTAARSIQIDDSAVLASYANFCRVSSTPEELILDLGLNPQPMNPDHDNIEVSQRIILNHFTAKRLLNALSMAVQRHERAFGVLEVDVRKRVQTQ